MSSEDAAETRLASYLREHPSHRLIPVSDWAPEEQAGVPGLVARGWMKYGGTVSCPNGHETYGLRDAEIGPDGSVDLTKINARCEQCMEGDDLDEDGKPYPGGYRVRLDYAITDAYVKILKQRIEDEKPIREHLRICHVGLAIAGGHAIVSTGADADIIAAEDSLDRARITWFQVVKRLPVTNRLVTLAHLAIREAHDAGRSANLADLIGEAVHAVGRLREAWALVEQVGEGRSS